MELRKILYQEGAKKTVKTVTEFLKSELKNENLKTVVYFLGYFSDQTPAHNDGFESLEYLLLPFKAAHRALTFENAKNILKQADDYIRETYRKLLS